jgi:uncharacterized protein (DUF1501 family)
LLTLAKKLKNQKFKLQKENPTMNESPLFSRREFLRHSSLLALASTAPGFLLSSAQAASSSDRDLPILVVVQLAGGNDGLNTVVPFTNDIYYKSRPRLALKGDDLIKLDDHRALNAQLKPLMKWGECGELAIVEGVGYPNPDRSHFRSTEIWETAVDSDKTSNTGWIGRYLDATCEGKPLPTNAVAIGNDRPQSFTGAEAMTQPEAFGYLKSYGNDHEGSFKNLNGVRKKEYEPSGNESLDFLRRTAMNATLSSSQVRRAAQRYRGGISYPNSELAKSLRTVAMMIAGRMPTRIYYVSQTGYDTHANQRGSHQRLMGQLAAALTAFQNDIEHQGQAERVVTMTFSEFGRRVKENGSNGTDHGTAAPMFFLGKNVNGGFHGKPSSLSDLDSGDLKFTVDFRHLYANALHWLQAPTAPVLQRNFDPLPGLLRV